MFRVICIWCRALLEEQYFLTVTCFPWIVFLAPSILADNNMNLIPLLQCVLPGKYKKLKNVNRKNILVNYITHGLLYIEKPVSLFFFCISWGPRWRHQKSLPIISRCSVMNFRDRTPIGEALIRKSAPSTKSIAALTRISGSRWSMWMGW